MATLSSKKKQRASSQNTQHYSTTLDIRELSPNNTRTVKDDRISNSPLCINVRREWPSWPEPDALAQKAADLNTIAINSSNRDLTPMERWRLESQQESPWNGIKAVDARTERQVLQSEESPTAGSQRGDTDNGTWWPRGR